MESQHHKQNLHVFWALKFMSFTIRCEVSQIIMCEHVHARICQFGSFCLIMLLEFANCIFVICSTQYVFFNPRTTSIYHSKYAKQQWHSDRFRQAQMEKERERDGDGEGGGKMHAHKYSCLTTKQVMN